MIVFVSNFLSHHQTGLCFELLRLTNGDFTFIATEPLPKESIDLGFKDRNSEYPFVIRAYESEEAYRQALTVCKNADVAIIGSASDDYIKVRNNKKITFKYSERPNKTGNFCKAFLSEMKHHYRFLNKNIYLLCASAYTAYDHTRFGMYKNKSYKWGYFPEDNTDKDVDVLIKEKTPNSILWAGRQLGWKHPESAVNVAKQLKADGVHFTLNIIGNGCMYEQLKDMIKKENLEENVKLLGAVPPKGVLEYMAKSEIFLLTSDRNEGWGGVLNEAMSSGCAVVASNEAGSVPYLIQNGKNGLIYQRKDNDSLYINVRKLTDNNDLRKSIQKNAFDTIKQVWNVKVAACRLLHLIDCIKKGKEIEYTFGPCSKDNGKLI